MHIIQGVSSLNRKKRKQKITKAKMLQFQENHRKHNKYWKQKGHRDMMMTFDEYIDYVYGKRKVKQTKTESFVPDHYVNIRKRESRINSKPIQADKHACSKQDDSYKRKVSSQYVIGQAYNKSGLQVLTKQESGDSATGKRR
jgi:uncharacterized Fe-S cluster-containing radical SAM superfamily enzyme